MNRAIVRGLEKLRVEYDEKGDENRERAYGNAIESILNHDQKITSGREAMQLPGIGVGIGWRIDKILGTDTVQENEKAPPKKKKTQRKRLASRQSKDDDGESDIIRTTEPLRIKFLEPTSVKARGTTLLPRDRAESILQAVQKECPKEIHVVLADTYRRGYADMSRLCILMTDKMYPKSREKADRLIHYLTADRLSNVFRNCTRDRNGNVCGQIFNTTTTFSMISVPACEWCFSLMYFTGPHPFWEKMQSRAQSFGYRLTPRSLGMGHVREDCRTERDIFVRLRLDFIPPEHRM